MEVNSLSDNGFVISNNHFKVECDFKDNKAAIFKNGEVSDYCKIFFPYSWDVSNLVQIINVVTDKVLFEVDLKGSNFNEWVNQLLKGFADFLNDDIILGYYDISGIRIVKCL